MVECLRHFFEHVHVVFNFGAGFQVQVMSGMNLYSLLPCVSQNSTHVRARSLDSAEVNRIQSDTKGSTPHTNNAQTNGSKVSADAHDPSEQSKKKKLKVSHQQLQIHGHHMAVTAPSSTRPTRKRWTLKSLRIKRSASDTSMKANLKDKIMNKPSHNNNHLQVPGVSGGASPKLRKSTS